MCQRPYDPFFFFFKIPKGQHKNHGFCRSAFISLCTIAEVKKNKSNFLIKVLSCGRKLPKLRNREVQEKLVFILKFPESSMILQGSIRRGRNRNQLAQSNNQDTPRNHCLSKGISLSPFFPFPCLRALLPWLIQGFEMLLMRILSVLSI